MNHIFSCFPRPAPFCFPSLLYRLTWWLNQQVPGALGQAGFVPACVQWRYCVTPGFAVVPCPDEGRDNPVEIHTATPKGLTVFPLLYSLEFYRILQFLCLGVLRLLNDFSSPYPHPVVARCMLRLHLNLYRFANFIAQHLV